MVWQSNYCVNFFFRKSISHRNEKKPQIFLNKSVYSGLSILKTSKIAAYEFWQDHVRFKYEKNQNYVIWIKTSL